MRVAVTGASGFVGAALCRRLARAGHEVVPFDRRANNGTHGWDISAGPLPTPPPVEAVIHVAAYVCDSGSITAARAVNVIGTENVADSFPRAKFVHVSTCSVYDPGAPQQRAREDEAPDPGSIRWSNAYGRTKAEAERLLAASRPDAVVLRPHAVYGPGDATLQPRLRHAARHGVMPVPGTGRQLHSVTSVDNFTSACLLALADDAVPGTYNVSDADPVPIAEVLSYLAAPAGGGPVRTRPLPVIPLLALAVAAEGAAALTARLRQRPVTPLLTRYTVGHLAAERTFDISAARKGLGYTPEPSTFENAARW